MIPENIEDIRKQLNETGYCMAGMPATPENALVQKIGPLPEDFYETAVKEKYRFFSFGDAMFIK